MEVEKNTCPHCGQSMREYKVSVTPILVKMLVKFRMAVLDKGENKVHLLKDMDGKDYELTKHEWNNFTRLRFHALAVKVKDESGYWLMTKRGADFLNGKVEIPREVWIRNNRIVEHSENLIGIKDLLGISPYLEKLEDIVYRSFEPNQTTLI